MRKFAFALPLLMAACTADDLPQEDRGIAPILTSEEALDEFTYARPLEARVAVVEDVWADIEGVVFPSRFAVG